MILARIKSVQGPINAVNTVYTTIGFDIGKMEEAWDGDQYRTVILEVDPLYEVSPCTFPAYTDTSISARAQQSMEDAKQRYKEAQQKKRETWRAEMRSRLKGE